MLLQKEYIVDTAQEGDTIYIQYPCIRAMETIFVEAAQQIPQEVVDEQMMIEEPSSSKGLSFITTGKELLDMKVQELPYLVTGLMPKVGVIALAGSSDTGKSTFLRQLATAIVTGVNNFIGFEITAEHRSALYVSTEDDDAAMAYLLSKQNSGCIGNDQFERLRFIFETEHLLKNLEAALKSQPADCIIIDTFTDLYGGELNASNKVRSYINDYLNLAKKYKCLIIYLHHTGKRTEYLPPSKDNLIGSQGFEGKMRLVLELRKDYQDPSLRHLCIVKGNYISDAAKGSSYVLKFDDQTMLYTYENRRVPFTQLSKQDPRKANNTEVKLKAARYRSEGLSISDVKRQLASDGVKVARSTVYDWVKDCPIVQSPIGEADDGQEQDPEEEIAYEE